MKFEEIKSNIDFKALNDFRLEKKKIIDSRTNKILISCLLTIIIVLYFIWPHVHWIQAIIVSIILFVILYGILVKLFVRKYLNQFIIHFRDNVISVLLNSLKFDVKLNLEKVLSRSMFNEGKLFTNFNVFNPEEFFEGTIDELPISFSELLLEYKSRRYTNRIFYGFFIKLHYNLDTNLIIDVIEDSTNSDVLQKLNFKRNQLVKIEDSEFERYYVVYSNNVDLTKSLISNTVIDNLKKLNVIAKNRVYFSIRNGSIHVAYNDERNYFEIDKDKTIEELTETHFNDLNDIFVILKEIKMFFDSNIIPAIPKN